ncbi:MAG TPA: hypothetical protein VLE95_00440 [Chlamydiales bacterium]|nr:hypothetical protein [Chlamydiales bacterium]
MKIIADEITNKTEPSIIYHKVVSTLQNARHEIALTHTPKEACYFGVRRDDPQVHQGHYTTPSTVLFGPYEEYNTKYMEQLTNILAKIPHDLVTFEKTARVVHETVMGKKCSFKVELLDEEELKKRKYFRFPSEQELHEALDIRDKSPQEISDDYDLMQQLKREQKSLYDRLVLGKIFCRISQHFPFPEEKIHSQKDFIRREPKDMFVLGTLRLELEPNTMVCMARHLTWMHRNWEQDPVDRMREHSVNFVIHQDPFLIERTQKACSQIFARVLAWDNTKPLESLKDNIALLRFVYGNSMPCSRGDGAVGDWLELALYRHHGFEETKHNSKRLPCFELLSTTSLSEYLKNYRDTIFVK